MIPSAAGSSNSRHRSSTWFGVALLSAVLLLSPFVLQAAFSLNQDWRVAFVHNDTTYPEGASIYAFLYPLRTGHLYAAPFQYPWNVQLYGPLFYIAGASIAWLVHGDAYLATIIARMLAFASLAGSSVLLGLMAFRLERSRRWALLAFLISIGCPWDLLQSVSARPDSPSIIFFLAALAVYLMNDDRPGIAFACGLLCSISVLFKQSTAPVALLLLIDPLIRRKPSKALAMLAGALPAPGLIFAALWLRHEPVAANLLGIFESPADWARIPNLFFEAVHRNKIVLVPLTLAVLGLILSWRIPNYATVARLALVAWLSALLSLAHLGSSWTYLVLPYLLSVLFLPPALVWLSHRSGLLQLAPALIGLLGIVLLFRHRDRSTLVLNELNTAPVHNLVLLSDLPFLEAQSRDPQYLDVYYYGVLTANRDSSNAAFNQRIAGGAYDLVLMNRSGLPVAVNQPPVFVAAAWWGNSPIDALRSSYCTLCEVDQQENSRAVLALVPKNRSSPANSNVVSQIFGSPCHPTNIALAPSSVAR